MSNFNFHRVAKTVGACSTDITKEDFDLILAGVWPSCHVHPDCYGALISLVDDAGWEVEIESHGYSRCFIELCQEALKRGAEFLLIDVAEQPVRETEVWNEKQTN